VHFDRYFVYGSGTWLYCLLIVDIASDVKLGSEIESYTLVGTTINHAHYGIHPALVTDIFVKQPCVAQRLELETSSVYNLMSRSC
jgi:hypothetical protein